jgi:hypothetical protein
MASDLLSWGFSTWPCRLERDLAALGFPKGGKKMNRSKRLTIILLCVMAIAFAATFSVAADQQVVQGPVAQTDAGIVIQASDADYVVAGQDMSEMVGKEVTVVGTVSESGNTKTINVMEIKEVKD